MQRLKHRADFVAASAAPRVSAPAFVLQARGRGDEGPARFGFTVSRKVGTATERNRVRRRLRDVVRRTDAASIAPGNDYVLVARRVALGEPFERLMADFQRALRRIAAKRRTGTPEVSVGGTHAAVEAETAGARPQGGARKGA